MASAVKRSPPGGSDVSVIYSFSRRTDLYRHLIKSNNREWSAHSKPHSVSNLIIYTGWLRLLFNSGISTS